MFDVLPVMKLEPSMRFHPTALKRYLLLPLLVGMTLTRTWGQAADSPIVFQSPSAVTTTLVDPPAVGLGRSDSGGNTDNTQWLKVEFHFAVKPKAPLPYLDSDRLASVGLVAPIEPQEFMLGGSYYEWQDHQKPFAALTSEAGVEPCDLNEVNPVRLDCASVENNFLPTLGVTPIVGRNFLPSEDRPNASRVALISFALWRSRFQMERSVVGKIVKIDGNSTQVIGVLPANFEMPRLQSADVLVPEALDVAYQRTASPGRPLWAFARLKPGVTPEQAKAQLESLFNYSLQLAPAPFRKEVHYTVRPLRDRQFHDVHQAAWILLGLVIAVLLIACANVASLLTARRAGREREMAVRAALGAGRMRLLQQAVIESLALTAAGALVAVFFAKLLLRVFILIAPEGMPFLSAAKVD